MLAQEDVASYLLEHGLIGPEAVLDGDLAIEDASSRNRNFRVRTRNGPGYLLKQGAGPDDVAGIAYEAGVYQRLASDGGKLQAYVPQFYGYDPSVGVLALELVAEAESLRALHVRSGRFSAGPAASLGSALGVLHASAELSDPTLMPPSMPWVLWLHRPDARVFRDVSAAGLELIRIVQSADGFPDAVDGLRAEWSGQALVHGDMKWDNCLIGTGGDGAKLIDWESAALGDPGWDIGSALGQYLSFWLFSIPVTGTMPPERFPELARYPLDAMKPALTACWLAYVAARGLDGDASAELLPHVISFAGARLLQTAFEAAQMMQQLTSPVILHLQLALNLLQRPQEAATDLLGLPLTGATIR